MDKRGYFLKIFQKASRKYAKSQKRLAADGWPYPWQTLITTILSAQSRDETTIPIAENLYKKYPTLEELADARYEDVLSIFQGLNYNRTKARHAIAAAKYLIKEHSAIVPESVEDLVCIPGVGRKTANLVACEIYSKEGVCVDTHVHRLSNVLGLVETKNPHQTEKELRKIAPRKYWSRINRLFVLWGKDVPGYDKKRLLKWLER